MLKTGDELLQMIDNVFSWLCKYSHTDPSFPALKEGLLEYKYDDGELDDCLKKLHKDGYIYFMKNPDVVQYYNRDLTYLITFDGKLFIKTVGGYRNKYANDAQKIANENAMNQRMEKNAQDLVTWTQNLTNRTTDLMFWTRLVAIGALGLVFWEIVKFVIERGYPVCH